MSSSKGPLHTPRLIALGLSWCFAVVAAAVGLNALVKSNQAKSKLKKLAPPPTVVDINTDDIFIAGVVATTASLLIAVLVFNFIAAMVLPFTKAISTRTLRPQGIILILASLFLFGAMIPYMVFFVNRHAIVKAFIGTTQLPDAIVKGVEKSSGSTSIYKEIPYLKLVAILPWFALLFTVIAAVILLKAGSGVSRARTTSHGSSSPVLTEKEAPSHREHA